MTDPTPPATPRVAIVGAGDIGSGWAALCAAHGWDTAIFDTDVRIADRVASGVARRARALASMGRADGETVEHGLRRIRLGRSLLQVCGQADWIIEAVPEDLALKQRLFENIDQVARPDAIISSSSSGHPISEIAARARHQDRCIVVHPLNPPELIPLVEIVPGKFTAPATGEQVRDWLRDLGRIPVTLRKEVPGNAIGRIAAAVWRESIDLVLEGVMDVSDIDRAVSLGPGVGWAAAGPHLTYHLASGEGGVGAFLQGLLQSFESWWGSLAHWSKLEPDQARALIAQIERAYGDNIEIIREARDRRLDAILKGLEASRKA